jgi:multiple sugar transport system substrate-binding protein
MVRKIIILSILCLFFTSCINKELVRDEKLIEKTSLSDSKDLKGTSFENLDIPKGYNIRQFEGMTLNFIVENNLYANILSHESEEFSKITGINIKIKAVDFDTLIQKVNLDFIDQAGKYELVYVDPYQTLNRFYGYLEILDPYNKDAGLPHVKGYTDDFFETQASVSANFMEDKNLYTIPFDSTTMILYYRKDIFDKYKDVFYKEMGYDWTPGTREFTWERYCEVAEWINKNVPDDEVRYGSGHMAQKHNSIFCDFSNVLAAYGGDYFGDENISTLGLTNFNKINVLNPEFKQALDMYKKILSVSAPESINWNWTDSANAFRNGYIAMMPNWDENYTYMEDAQHSKVAGKVGYAILPYGDVRSANLYGGSGIGINKYATEDEKQAAWLYIVWATSTDMQLKALKHPEGGVIPTRKSAYEDQYVYNQIHYQSYINKQDVYLKHINAVLNAWKPENIYLRPKVSNFYSVENVLIENLRRMVQFNTDSTKTSEEIYDALEQIKEGK